MSSNNESQFGGAISSAIDEVIGKGIGAVSNDEAGSVYYFLSAWVKNLQAHADFLYQNNQKLEVPVVIVYTKDSSDRRFDDKKWKSKAMFGLSASDPYEGVLAACTAGFGGHCYVDKLKNTDDFENEIYKVGLQESLTISLVTNQRIVVWPEGISNQESCFIIELNKTTTSLSLDEVESELGVFYEKIARMNKSWWKDSKSRITVEQPENAVQHDLKIFLTAKYSTTALIREEAISGNGRMDITIRPLDINNDSAVLELKTIRDFRTPKRAKNTPIKIRPKLNIRWATSGVQQAAAYRDEEKFTGAFLCIYDFTAEQGRTVEKAIQDVSNKYDIKTNRYWITASHEEHRKERYTV